MGDEDYDHTPSMMMRGYGTAFVCYSSEPRYIAVMFRTPFVRYLRRWLADHEIDPFLQSLSVQRALRLGQIAFSSEEWRHEYHTKEMDQEYCTLPKPWKH